MRKYPNEEGILSLAPGEYGKDLRDNKWYARPPNPEIHLAGIDNHEITEHDDGTITVSPSILITTYDDDRQILWHGFLEKGVWREC